MGDIPTELSKDKTDVKFSLRLVENGLEKGELVFVNLKARTYPGTLRHMFVSTAGAW